MIVATAASAGSSSGGTNTDVVFTSLGSSAGSDAKLRFSVYLYGRPSESKSISLAGLVTLTYNDTELEFGERSTGKDIYLGAGSDSFITDDKDLQTESNSNFVEINPGRVPDRVVKHGLSHCYEYGV